MKSNSLNIDLEVYTGPFDVLLRLIEKQKVDIYDIKIEDITSPYMEAINEMDIPLGQLSEFIYISSILLYIKSSKLMPKDKNDTVEEDFISYLISIKRLDVNDYIKKIRNTLKFTKSIRLNKITDEIKSKDACIGTFLALLELVRLKEIYLEEEKINEFLIVKRDKNE